MTSALLIIDMVNDHVDGLLANESAKALIEPIADLAASARDRPGWLVAYAGDSHHLEDAELSVLPPHAMAGTTGAAIVAELTPSEDDIYVPKRSYSAFTGTDLHERLQRAGVELLVVAGQQTDCSILLTCYDAFSLGYELVVPADATAVCASLDRQSLQERQRGALSQLKSCFGASIEQASSLL